MSLASNVGNGVGGDAAASGQEQESHVAPANLLATPIKEKNKGLSALKRIVKKTALGKLKVASLFSSILAGNRKKEDEATNEERQHPASDDEDEDANDDADLPDLDVLRTFSPLIVHHQVYSSQKQAPSSQKLAPACQTHFGCILFADISGFTRLANLLSVDQLQLHISKYFKMLFDCVERFGGDILKICGDAIMIMWPLEKEMAQSSVEERAACALTASLCGREMILSCGTYTATHGEHRISLSLHCGVGVADVQCYWVGKGGRWEFLISGDALTQIASTEPEAKSGEIVISSQAYDLISLYVGATKTPGGNWLLSLSEIKSSGVATTGAYPTDDYRFIAGLSDHPTLNFDRQRAIATRLLGRYARSNPDSEDLLNEADEDEMATGLQYFVHHSARSRLRHLGKDFQMAELREVVTLFVNITGLEEDFRLKRLDVIQSVMAVIVDSHKCFGGALRQFVVDDKVCV
jgi:class 3 adenylate cyclase